MHKLFFVPFTIVLFLLFSCEPEEEQISGLKSLKLTFSEDTVLFDTLLSDTLSLTRRFRIYNPNEKAVKVNSIRLGKGNASAYSIIVNGKQGPAISDEVIFGRDSILVLVSVDIDPMDQNNPYLVKDSVIVEWNANSDHVKLVAWGQDANYIRNVAICDEVWTKDRPYVIQNFAVVDSMCTLTVEPGTKIYMDNGASLVVEGTLRILGDSADRVIIRNTRFDENYLEAPGQWNGIVFMETSTGNEISYCDIENGQIGIGIGYTYARLQDGSTVLLPETSSFQASIVIDHTSIRHMSLAGILAFSSDVYAYNTEIYNCATYLVGNLAGGTYRYEHCTFSNLPSFFNNEDPTIQFSDNLILSEEQSIVEDLHVTIRNSILWGSGEEELLINNGGGAGITLTLETNIIKSNEEIPDNFTSSESDFPGFVDPFMFDYQLDSLAFARDKASTIGITTDLLGVPRDDMPDIGAYERIDMD